MPRTWNGKGGEEDRNCDVDCIKIDNKNGNHGQLTPDDRDAKKTTITT